MKKYVKPIIELHIIKTENSLAVGSQIDLYIQDQNNVPLVEDFNSGSEITSQKFDF